MIPFANATLTEVREVTYTADFDRDAEPAAGVAKWSGTQPAYYRDTVERFTTGQGSDVLVVRELYLDSYDAAQMVEEGDTLHFDWAGLSKTGMARAVARRTLPGHPLQTTRIELELG